MHKYIHIYTCTNTHACTHGHMLTHTYTYIHTTYIDQSRHGEACCFHCLMAFLKTVSDERFFISLGGSSQVFDPKWESDSVPCKTVRTGRE